MRVLIYGVLAVVLVNVLLGCAGFGGGLAGSAEEGFVAGIGDAAPKAPSAPPGGIGDLLKYGLEYIVFLLAYATGSLGKGYIRSKLAEKVEPTA